MNGGNQIDFLLSSLLIYISTSVCVCLCWLLLLVAGNCAAMDCRLEVGKEKGGVAGCLYVFVWVSASVVMWLGGDGRRLKWWGFEQSHGVCSIIDVLLALVNPHPVYH